MGATCTYWGFVKRSGDSMTGTLYMGEHRIAQLALPVGACDAARYNQLESQVHDRVSRTGDTMSGNLAMGGNRVTGLGAPTAQDDALRKGRAEVALGDLKLAQGSWSGTQSEFQMEYFWKMHYNSHLYRVKVTGANPGTTGFWETSLSSGVFDSPSGRINLGGALGQSMIAEWQYHVT